jgi:hypothetical protein
MPFASNNLSANMPPQKWTDDDIHQSLPVCGMESLKGKIILVIRK